jgi:predicted LPLAT superfamily acyltransferase
MPAWQGKSRGTPLGYRIFVAVLKRFGVIPAYALLRMVVLYYFLFSWRSSKPILHYFRRLGYSRPQSFLRLYRNYYLLGQTLIDRIVVMTGIPNRFTFDFDGEENLLEMAELKKGGLLLSAHIGNWEIAGHLLKRLQTRIHIVMFDGEHQRIKEYLESVTGERKAHIIVIRNDFSHIYEINEAFKNNELVCIHADRFLEGNKTLTATLLGEKAPFPAGPFQLAASFQVPVSFVFALKESNLHYHFFAGKWKTCSKTDMQEMLDAFAIDLESKIKRYPEQWYNYYNFWQPQHEPAR